ARKGTISFAHGETLVDDELDPGDGPYSVIGAGPQFSRMLVTAFGADKKVFRNGATGSASRDAGYFFSNFQVRSSTGSADKAHPIAFFFPWSSEDLFENVWVRLLGNTAFW